MKIESKLAAPLTLSTASVLLLALLHAPLLWAVDTDGDGSTDAEEILAGTDATNPDERPYWWKTFSGDSTDDNFGYSVSNAGDVNNDSYADIVVGAYGDDANGLASGSARVISGLDGSMLHTFYGDSLYGAFGQSVSGAGDVNNDGYADIVIGAPRDNNGNNSGSARVFSGVDGSLLYSFNGDSADDRFGMSVSGAGDINNDGYDDIVVGAYFDDNNGMSSGSARVFSGLDGAVLYTFNGDSAYDYFGWSVSAAGDINNDGYDDVVIGAYDDDNTGANSGSAQVLSGQDGSVLYIFNGDKAWDRFGYSVSDAGDVNNDGYDDIVIGSYGDDSNGSYSGSSKVLSGKDGLMLYTFNGDSANDRFGWSVSGAGDINNDGHDDIVIGAWLDDNNDENSGSVRVLSGLDGSTLYTFNGGKVNDRFGVSVSGAGDVDADGLADIVIGTLTGSVRVILSSDLNSDADLDYVTNNADLDDDNDGISDQVENTYTFLDPLNAGDAMLDQDGDGSSNLAEILAGTDPTNPADFTQFPPRAVNSDFNADGRADILWRKSSAAQTTLVLTNNAAAQEAIINTDLIPSDWSAQQADFNGDTRMDLLWRNNLSGAAYAVLSSANGSTDLAIELEQRSTAWSSSIGDFNGDSIDDILWRQPVSGDVQIAISATDGSTERIEQRISRYSAWDHQIADFNGDNRSDILWRKPSTGEVSVVLSDTMGNQGVVSVHLSKWSAWTATIGDFNGDLRDDILWRKANNGIAEASISGVLGEQESITHYVSRFNAWTDTVGDFNGDGRDDVLWRRPVSGEVIIAISNNEGGQASFIAHLAKSSAWQHKVADYNGDGIDDILWRKPATGTVKVIVNNALAAQASVVDHYDKGENWQLVR